MTTEYAAPEYDQIARRIWRFDHVAGKGCGGSVVSSFIINRFDGTDAWLVICYPLLHEEERA